MDAALYPSEKDVRKREKIKYEQESSLKYV